MQIPEVIKTISIDLETYSSVPIKNGVYPYAESPDSEILMPCVLSPIALSLAITEFTGYIYKGIFQFITVFNPFDEVI